jgi:predicted transcriptional regulator
MATTIQIDEKLRDKLNSMKMHPRETYNDVLERLFEDMQELSAETKKDIQKALKEIESGKFKTHDEVKKDMGFQ